MKKIKKLWNENKVLMVLGMILIVCFIAIFIVVMTYFMGSNKSVYGERFDNMKTHIKEKEQQAYVDETEKNEKVEKVRLRVTGKTIYISVEFKSDVKLDDAKKIAEESMKLFSEDIQETYDINVTVKNEKYTLMGAKNAVGNGFYWNNNNVEEKEDEK